MSMEVGGPIESYSRPAGFHMYLCHISKTNLPENNLKIQTCYCISFALHLCFQRPNSKENFTFSPRSKTLSVCVYNLAPQFLKDFTLPEPLQIHFCRNRKNFVQGTIANVYGQPGVAQKMPFLLRLKVLHHDITHVPERREKLSGMYNLGRSSGGI